MTQEISAPHMTSIERQLYEDGHVEEYRGFKIVPKLDFGPNGFWSPEYRCHLNAGWVVTSGSGRYAGCNAAPGATFAWTLQGARDMIDDLIAAGGSGDHNEVGGGIDADEFWRLNRARHAAKQEA